MLKEEQSHLNGPDCECDNPKYYHVAAAAWWHRRQEEDLAKNDLHKEKEFLSTFVMLYQ